MDDKALANMAVKHQLIVRINDPMGPFYAFSSAGDLYSASAIVIDGRVAMAAMEKVHDPIKILCCEDDYCVEITVYGSDEEAEPTIIRAFDPNSRSRAILQTCLGAINEQ